MSEAVKGISLRDQQPDKIEDTSPPEVPPIKPAMKLMMKQPGRWEKIKWPKECDQAALQKLDTDLSQLLELALRGSIENSINIIGKMIL